MNEHSFSIRKAQTRGNRTTKARILKAATDVIAAQGYANTGIREIIQQAEVSVGSFYTYFEKKEDVLIALIREAGATLRTRLQKTFATLLEKHQNGLISATEEGLAQSFLSLYDAFFAFVKEKRKLFLVVFREGVLTDPAITPATKQVFAELTEDVEERIAFASQIGMMQQMGKGERKIVAEAIVGLLVHSAQSFLESGANRYAARLKTLVAFSVSGTVMRKNRLRREKDTIFLFGTCPECGYVMEREGQ